MNSHSSHNILPSPAKTRWQPLRAGLVNIFFYDYEEFWFRDGHLLLRGNNGTGKSKVLALTLPFLLDGQLTPARVEPDGDPGKRMDWNLLLGGKYPERLGYTWIEFGRLNDAGSPEFVTLGCGLKAVQGRGTQSWFFITDRRIGESLWLVENDFPLGRERLIEALGNRGRVYEAAARYRRAVDEKLFQLGEERYSALVNLLIQLRQPQLSKRPNEQALSVALTEALRPLDQTVLSDVADAFRNLESERDELDALKEAGGAVDQFRGHYRAYAQIAARRRARDVRQKQSHIEKLGGDLNETRSRLEDSERRQRELEARRETLEGRIIEARSAERTLRDSPEMRDANALRHAEASAVEKAAGAAEARDRQREAEQDLERRRSRLQERETATGHSREAVQTAVAEAGEHAGAAGIDGPHRTLLMPLALPDGDPEAGREGLAKRIATAEQQTRELLARRQRSVQHLRDLNRALERAEQRLAEAKNRLQTELDQAERLEDERLQAEQAVQQAGATLVETFDRFAREARELRISEPPAVTAALAEWINSLVGENPAAAALSAAYRNAADNLAQERAQTTQAREAVQVRHDELAEERARLQAGEHARPPIPYVRDEATRADRPGAPLWQLVDFREEIPENARAGLEAALEGAGLLDAWVMPDGALLSADTWDAILAPLQAPLVDNLKQALFPAVDRMDPRTAAVSDTVLQNILAGIGVGENGPVSVSEDGRWRLGPAHGAWHKERAQYIGRGAREAARRQRLTELESELAAVCEQLAGLDRALQILSERRKVLEQEWRAAPTDSELRRAHDRVAYLLEQRRDLQAHIEQAETAVAKAKEIAEQHADERDRSAADLHLPSAPAALEAVAAALADYRATLGAFWPQLRHHWDNRAALALASEESEEAERRLEDSAEQAAEKEKAALEAAAHRDTLRATVGEAVAALERRLAETDDLIKTLEAEGKQIQKTSIDLAGQLGNLSTRIRDLDEQLEREREQRHSIVRGWQAFAADGLLDAAIPDLAVPERADEWPVNLAVQLARQTEQALQDVDDGDSAWSRHQRGLFEHLTHLQGALSRHGHEASAEQTDSGLIVRVVFQAKLCSPDELVQNLAAEIRERQALLNARERELLENHLVSEVASHLQGMIADAEQQVRRMNEELERRPTSTGMKLRLVWKPLEEGVDGAPVGLGEARKRLLRQISDAWSAEDRTAIGEFLHRRIDDVRQNHEGGTSLELLEKALDYRRWHRFQIERRQDGQWRSAMGPASGGERVLAVTIPLFAAASSHYGSAGPQAPRLVLLDEAFAGVDDDSRAKCMGLLAQFDLDFVMTSEREWGCYADLPGLAIAQLARREGIDAVYVSRWTWDGARRERADIELPSMEASHRLETETMAEPDGALF